MPSVRPPAEQIAAADDTVAVAAVAAAAAAAAAVGDAAVNRLRLRDWYCVG